MPTFRKSASSAFLRRGCDCKEGQRHQEHYRFREVPNSEHETQQGERASPGLSSLNFQDKCCCKINRGGDHQVARDKRQRDQKQRRDDECGVAHQQPGPRRQTDFGGFGRHAVVLVLSFQEHAQENVKADECENKQQEIDQVDQRIFPTDRRPKKPHEEAEN